MTCTSQLVLIPGFEVPFDKGLKF
jgi:hypothetical protein